MENWAGSEPIIRRADKPGGATTNRTPTAEAAADTAPVPTQLIGRSPQMLHLLSMIERVAPTDSSVLITGATGTGKELIARTIHSRSRRSAAPFVDINCSAIPDTLIESELFGHQRGTFTGANETRRGLFEEASGGTIFLDEIDALSLQAQAKLLRVLQERQLRRVGGRRNLSVNVRVISATNRDLKGSVAECAFRADLFFRLRVIPLHAPDLRERGEDDIKLLIDHFMSRAQQQGARRRRFSAAALRAMLKYHWPGNVRELENAVEYALAVSRGEEMGEDDLPEDILHSVPDAFDSYQRLDECWKRGATLAQVEQLYVLSVLERVGGNHVKAALRLGIDRRTLYRKLKSYEE